MSEPETKTKNTLRAQAKRQQQSLRRTRVLLTTLLTLCAALFAAWQWAVSAPSGSPQAIPVTIPRGSSGLAMGNLLERGGVIRSAYAFVLQTRLNGGSRELKAGRYKLAGNLPLADVIAMLERGPNQSEEGVRVTIPEGYTLRQIADTLGTKGVVDGNELYRMATDPQAIAGLHADFALPPNTLEGYLFPDTYAFKPHTPPAAVLKEMLTNFGAHFARPYQQEISAIGHSLHELVTIASLIEREARIDADRARIAGVIDNRIKRKMRLEIDATVLYALGHHKSRVLYKDLNVKSPYNTYRHAGLPPGPIANPGLPCLLAALHPEQNDFVYYVARPSGAHIFTRTAQEHQAAIRQARAERQRENREQGTIEPEMTRP